MNMPHPVRLLILSRYDKPGASSRLPSLQYIPYLYEAGIYGAISSSFSNTMRTDALDCFGNLLKWRFTQNEIRTMIDGSRLNQIPFLDRSHYWGTAGIKK